MSGISDLRVKQIVDQYVGTALIFLLRPLILAAGFLMRRDHSLPMRGRILFMKFLGGGSLVIAYPSILALRRANPRARFVLLTTRSVRPFAELLAVFDEIEILDDSSVVAAAVSFTRFFARNLRVDTVVDFEVYSRFSTLFSVFLMARNRIGFYLDNIFWRKYVSTHLIYFNRHAGVYLFYDQVARLLGAEPAEAGVAREAMREAAGLPSANSTQSDLVVIGPACSEFGRERMLTPGHWRAVLSRRDWTGVKRVVVVGGRADFEIAEKLVAEAAPALPSSVVFENLCGKTTLREAVGLVGAARLYIGVDSSLLHFARLLGTPSVSYWGPTDPATRLRPIPGYSEEVVYGRIFCSPCIHVTESPPCGGDNRCIKALFDPGCRTDGREGLFTAWLGGGR